MAKQNLIMALITFLLLLALPITVLLVSQKQEIRKEAVVEPIVTVTPTPTPVPSCEKTIYFPVSPSPAPTGTGGGAVCTF